jgi:hypothetical protein
MTKLDKRPVQRNPTMEVALTAGSVTHEKPAKRKLSEPSAGATQEPVTIDYLQGFHRQS